MKKYINCTIQHKQVLLLIAVLTVAKLNLKQTVNNTENTINWISWFPPKNKSFLYGNKKWDRIKKIISLVQNLILIIIEHTS